MIGSQAVVVSLVGGPEVRGSLKTIDLKQVTVVRDHPDVDGVVSTGKSCEVTFDMALVDSIRREAKVNVENVPAMVHGKLAQKAAVVPVNAKPKK